MERKEAIEVIKKNWPDSGFTMLREALETLIPELAESEDENIRKGLISMCQTLGKEEWVAWLEKQGSEPNWCHHKVDLSDCSEEYCKAYYDGWNNCNMQHSQCKSELDDVLKCLINGMKFYYEDNKDATWGTDKWSMPVKHIIEVLEKQGEQKPADKVEPKFKVGDWIIDVQGVSANQIIGYEDDSYHIKTSCSKFYLPMKLAEKNYRLWTIQDAKEGDILYTPKGLGVEGIFLVSGWQQIEGTGKTLCSNIGYRVDDDEIVEGGIGAIWWKGVKDPFFPATKEQCDLLFQKIKEAEYKWDADTKELKNIEQKLIDNVEVSAFKDKLLELFQKFRFIKDDVPTNGDIIDYVDAHIQELIDTIQKPAWSEEDEVKINRIVACLENLNVADNDILLKDVDWLKSLKDRVGCEANCTTTKEWSEEDETYRNYILINCMGYADKTGYVEEKNNRYLHQNATDWLKSLRPQSTWKPSEEQMKAVGTAIKFMDYEICTPTVADNLRKLLEQLKTL